MIGLAVRLLSGRFGGVILGAVAVALLGMVSFAGWQAWDRHSLRTKVAETQSKLADARLQTELMRSNRDQLARALEKQSSQVRALEQAAERVREKADQAARDVMADAEGRRQADADVGSDPEAMNRWLHELFSF